MLLCAWYLLLPQITGTGKRKQRFVTWIPLSVICHVKNGINFCECFYQRFSKWLPFKRGQQWNVPFVVRLSKQWNKQPICRWFETSRHSCDASVRVYRYSEKLRLIFYIKHYLKFPVKFWNCFHDDVIKWKHFRFTGRLWGESTGHRWIPLTKVSGTEPWCFLWSAPEQTVYQTIETPMIWDANALIMVSLYCHFITLRIALRVNLELQSH